jgi:hypothetical protein
MVRDGRIRRIGNRGLQLGLSEDGRNRICSAGSFDSVYKLLWGLCVHVMEDLLSVGSKSYRRRVSSIWKVNRLALLDGRLSLLGSTVVSTLVWAGGRKWLSKVEWMIDLAIRWQGELRAKLRVRRRQESQLVLLLSNCIWLRKTLLLQLHPTAVFKKASRLQIPIRVPWLLPERVSL